MADNYWRRRQEKTRSLSKSETDLNKSLEKYYATESEKLSQEIASYYGKYGVENVIEYRKLLLSLSDSERQLLFEDYDAFADKYPEYADLLPVRGSIYKLNRAEGLKTSILLQQLEIGAIENSQLQAHFEKMAALFAETSGYSIDKNIAKLAVGQSWFEETDFSARIWANRKALAKTLQSDILNGIIRGDDYKTLARRVQTRFQKVSRRDIERLIFTEDTYLTNEAAMQTYVSDPDFSEYEYMIADGRACDVCASLDGQRFKIDERVPGVNFPPMHPWCRCTFVPVYSGSDAEKKAYFAKDDGLTSEGDGGIIRDERITKAVENGDITLTLNPEKQNPHIYGSKEYDPAQNKSYFTVSLEELQEILREKHGTGEIDVYPNGQIKERIKVENEIGVYVDENGAVLGKTNRFTIHYSKGRTHLVPARREEWLT